MGVITTNSNLSSVAAVRQLGKTSIDLAKVFERLASGMRINRASDDAAGLSIAARLTADARVYTQGLRNLNDGISLLSIADGALEQLGEIVGRQQELAEQAANGTYSTNQRDALDTEAQSLREEFNRIVQSVTFNGTSLFQPGIQNFALQDGYGSNGSLQVYVGTGLARDAGTGTFSTALTLTVTSSTFDSVSADFNGDGFNDIAAVSLSNGQYSIVLSNGDGTFKARQDYAVATNDTVIITDDFNGDGIADLGIGNRAGPAMYIMIGNGNGSFKAGVSYAIGAEVRAVASGDVNNDGYADIVTANVIANTFSVLLGTGTGTFKSEISIPVANLSGGNPNTIVLEDLDDDGNLDLIYGLQSNAAAVAYGNGTGTFSTIVTLNATNQVEGVQTGDFNNDGLLDVITGQTVYLANGNRTFQRLSPDFSIASGQKPVVGDFNEDGTLDVAILQAGKVSIYIGNGNGTFTSVATYTGFTSLRDIHFADLNGDNVGDLFVNDDTQGNVTILFADTQKSNREETFSLSTRSSALDALNLFNRVSLRVNNERAANGAYQSRISVAMNVLAVRKESYLQAASRITDADMALESSNLIRLQILQQAGAAVLAQANQQPALALTLLSSI